MWNLALCADRLPVFFYSFLVFIIPLPMMVVPEVVLYRRIHSSNLSYENLSHRTKAGNPMLLRALRASVHRKRMENNT